MTKNYFLKLTAAAILAVQVLSAYSMPEKTAALLKQLDVNLTDRDVNRISEIYNFWEQKGDAIWPGVEISEVPVQIVFPEKYDLLIGHPKPPSGCSTDTFKLDGINRKFCYLPDRTFLHGAMTSVINRTPTVSINTTDVFNGFVTAILRKSDPSAKEFVKPYLQYLGEIIHEMFHAYQMNENRHLPSSETDSAPLKLTKIDYPYQDETVCLLMGIEGKILSRLLTEKNPQAIDRLWRDFLLVRAERRKKLPKDIVILEKYMELTEGTAQYVGWSLQYGNYTGIKPLPATLNDPAFAGYASQETIRDTMKAVLEKLYQPGMSRWMIYSYYTGAALSYELDQVSKGWKKKLFRRTFGIKSGLDDIAAAGVKMQANSGDTLPEIMKQYDADSMLKEIRTALQVDLDTNAGKLKRLMDVKGRHYRFIVKNVKPEDVQIYAPVLITEYKNIRAFEAGANKIQWRTPEGQVMTEIGFSKAFPIIFDKDNGMVDVIIPESDYTAPVISAKNQEGEIYTGDVSFSTRYLLWKGQKLEISQNQDITQLVLQ